mmetsp:Transcript_27663/g.41870  ORF Transcript_27663/g.41870 Transcript_27663/m.41870 type:complete len:94 (+) Transcript_27663:110-391(+)
MAATLKEWKNESVTVITCDGRIIVGILAGHDQVQNLVLKDAEERVYSMEETVELVPLGLYVIRGDNVALVGDTSSWEDSVQAEPLPAIFQHVL